MFLPRVVNGFANSKNIHPSSMLFEFCTNLQSGCKKETELLNSFHHAWLITLRTVLASFHLFCFSHFACPSIYLSPAKVDLLNGHSLKDTFVMSNKIITYSLCVHLLYFYSQKFHKNFLGTHVHLGWPIKKVIPGWWTTFTTMPLWYLLPFESVLVKILEQMRVQTAGLDHPRQWSLFSWMERHHLSTQCGTDCVGPDWNVLSLPQLLRRGDDSTSRVWNAVTSSWGLWPNGS